MLFNPLIQSIAIPLGLTLVVAGLLRLTFGKERGRILACVAVAVGFLASYFATLGTPPLPPRSSIQKFPYLVLAGALLGLVLDLTKAGRATMVIGALFPAVGLVWLAWPLFGQFSVANGIAFAALAVCGGFITACFPVEANRSPGFFNATEFPTMSFASSKVEKTGERSARMTGNMTLLGVTKPVTLDVTFNKKAEHPLPQYNKILTAGFSMRGKLKRSEFGMKYALGGLGNEIELIIEAEGHKKK